METKVKKDQLMRTCLSLSADITKLLVDHMWADYDKEADVLYLSFRKPQRAKMTIERDDDILIRQDGNKVVGITILNASKRQLKTQEVLPFEECEIIRQLHDEGDTGRLFSSP